MLQPITKATRKRSLPLRHDLTADINILPERKRLLARILAAENITIEHGNVPTAMWDGKNKLLLLPQWPGLTNDETEMLLSHEVGHSVNTPWDMWIAAIKAKAEEEQKAFQSYLNIVEDARIERKMKSKWPGLNSTFYKGYHSLHHNRDAFKLRKEGIVDATNTIVDAKLAELRRIDRLNLAAKIGAEISLVLDKEEQSYYDRMMETETFEEVIALAEELYERQKSENEQEQQEQDKQNGQSGGDDQEQDDNGESKPGDKTAKSKGKGRVQKAVNLDDMMGEGDADGDAQQAQGQAQSGQGQQPDQGGQQGDGKDAQGRSFKPASGASSTPSVAMTDATWQSFVADQSGYDKNLAGANYNRNTWRPRTNLTSMNTVTLSDVPVELYSKIIEPVDKLVEKFRLAKTVTPEIQLALNEWRKEFMPILGSMVQEFQRHQRAKESFKVAQAQTGQIDMLKLPFYQVNDKIFKKTTILPKGKNHGIVMLVDWSGSMGCYIPGVVEQVIMLIAFCERMRIPLEVYAFTDSYAPEQWTWQPSNPKSVTPLNCGLLQFYSSSAPQKVCEAALQCMYAVKYIYEKNGARDVRTQLPAVMNLGNTPLHSSLLMMRPIIKYMREAYRLDRQAFVLVSDGDAGDWPESRAGGRLQDGGTARDERTGVLYRSKLPMGTLIEWLKDTTATTTIGIRLMHGEMPAHIANAWVSEQEDRPAAEKALASGQAFIEIPKTDFDAAYAVRSGLTVSRKPLSDEKDPLAAQATRRKELGRFVNAVVREIA